jgi:hypothetical protein
VDEVENVIISEKGRILGIVVEASGFIDIGETQVFMMWNPVRSNPTLDGTAVPLAQDNVEKHAWNDCRLMRPETARKPVAEASVTTGAQRKAVDEHADPVSTGYYAFPYYGYGYGWYPGAMAGRVSPN